VPGVIGQEHPDLTVVDLACGAGVLPLHPGRALAFLDEPGLVGDQNPALVADRLDQAGPDLVTNRVPVETRAAQQRLHRVRSVIAGLLREGPTVPPFQRRHQPTQILTSLPAGLHPTEMMREPQVVLLKLVIPASYLLNRHHA
jgi:hypothetical protein